MEKLRSGIKQLTASDAALIIVVVIGYIVGVASALDVIGPIEIIVTFVITAVYLSLARGSDQFFERYSSGWAKTAYFTIQMTLVLLTILILGPGAWLISLPMAALAVQHLDRWWQRWIIYLLILAGLMLPIAAEGNWQQAISFGLTLSPAIIFVVVFTRLANSEHLARQEAEELAAELEEANHQLADYSTKVDEMARTQERNRLAREIHDNLGHYLTVVNVQIRAAQAVMASDPQKAQEVLEKAQRLTQDGLTAVRQSVAALRESPLGGRSLLEAVDMLVNETQSSGVVIQKNYHGQPGNLDPKVELTLYRAVQEGLTNVRKHANASLVDLTLDFSIKSQASLAIADNGIGWTAVENCGYGLLGIKERVEILGGQMKVESSPNDGFLLEITLPLDQPNAFSPTVEGEET